MMEKEISFRRDLFGIDNAKHLTRDELVATFVPTKNFRRLLSPTNHVILGARGSGKTALAKMLSHDHLCGLSDPVIQAAVSAQAFIGIYVPMKLAFVGALKNKPWQTEEEAELFFQSTLNILTCFALLITLRSCLERYVSDIGSRARVERALAHGLAEAWRMPAQGALASLKKLSDQLEDFEYAYQMKQLECRALRGQSSRHEGNGGIFAADALAPLLRGITLASRELKFRESCSWLLCLDEAEVLNVHHHRILNSYLRTHSGRVTFKVTTMPYRHYTLETNTQVPLEVGHDFEYLYIDQDPDIQAALNEESDQSFASGLFNKRVKHQRGKYNNLRLGELLGSSVLLEKARPEDKDAQPKSNERVLELVRRYSNAKTVDRAERLFADPRKFQDEIARKLRGLLLLRDAIEKQSGSSQLDVYSGATMAVRCGDANPRRLIRIFNSLLLQINWSDRDGNRKALLISKREQTRILRAISTRVLTGTQSEDNVGPRLYSLLNGIGNFMAFHLLNRPLGTDQISSLQVDETVTAEEWESIKAAVGIGLLYPNINANNADQMPQREGKFRLGYILAPHFRLLPRRGNARSLLSIRRFMQFGPDYVDDSEQQRLFVEGGESNDDVLPSE